MSNNLANVSVHQLKQAIVIREKIEALEAKLSHILGTVDSHDGPAVPRKRKGISAAGKARIAAAQRARWAKLKGKKTAKVGRKGRRKMSPAARAKLAAAATARWAKVKAAGKSRL